VKRFCADLGGNGDDKDADENNAGDCEPQIQRHRHRVTTTFVKRCRQDFDDQKARVTSGTLLKPIS
jgi:hypothetical protein